MTDDLIHMSSEEVAALLAEIERLISRWEGDLSTLRVLRGTFYRVLKSPTTSDYAVSLHHILTRVERGVERLQANHRRAQREYDDWLLADARLGDAPLLGKMGAFLRALYRDRKDFFRKYGWMMLGPLGLQALVWSDGLRLVADPVDIATGVYLARREDLRFDVPGFPYSVVRAYVGKPPSPGWGFSFQFRLVERPKEVRILWGPGGLLGIFRFWREGEAFVADDPATVLEYSLGPHRYAFKAEDGNTYFFDESGDLRAIRSLDGIEVLFEPQGEEVRLVKDARGKIWGRIQHNAYGQVVRIEDESKRTFVYRYDGQGRLVAVRNRAGQTTRYQYTAQGLLASVIGPGGNKLLENKYDKNGRVVWQRDPAGYETRFAYSTDAETAEVRQATVTYPTGAEVRYFLDGGEVVRQQVGDESVEYHRDERSYIVEIRDPNGKVTRLEWDDAGRLVAVSGPTGETFRFSYDGRGALLSSEDPAGARTEMTYDEEGRPVRLRLPDGAEVRLEYDEHGLLVAWVDPLGRRVTVRRDEHGRIREIVLPDGATYAYAYPAPGKVEETDPLGRTVTYEYDPEDRLRALQGDGREARVEYTPEGWPASLANAQGLQAEVEYDPRGLPVTLRFPNGHELRQTYDALGHPVALRDAQERLLLKRTYDARGRLTTLTDAKGRSWHYDYDRAGNLIALTDRKGRTLRFEYDDAYRLRRVYDPAGRLQMEMEYDAAGRPRRIVDAEGHTFAFTFDVLGRLVATGWDGEEARAILDAAGQLLRLLDEKGRERTYAYDPQGHLVKEVYPLDHTYTYAYDAVGRLREETLPDGTRAVLAYDELDRVAALTYRREKQETTVYHTYSADNRELTLRDDTGEIRYVLNEKEHYLERKGVFGQTVRYEFGLEGQVERLIYPNKGAVTYEYDPNGNLTTIQDFAGYETRIDYDESDLPCRVTHPNGFATVLEYDAMDRVVCIRHLDAQGHMVLEQHLERDATGRVLTTEVTGPLTGKLDRHPDARARRTLTFNALDQITESDEGAFRYDRRGNLLAYNDNGQQIRLRYGLRDLLEEAQIDAEHFRYLYDAEGNRVAVTRNGRTCRFVLDTVMGLPRPLMELDEQGEVQRCFIWGAGLQYALDAEGNPEVYLFNHRGDTLAVVNGQGEAIAVYDYAAYGEVIGRYGVDVPFRFLGRWGIMADHDALYYLRARYYAPRLGVFTQPDRLHIYAPVPRFLNRYAYALDDPWNLVDVDGRFLNVLIGAVVGGALGAAIESGSQLVSNAIEHGTDFSQYHFDGASIAGAAVGGAVSGAIISTGVGAVPVLGGMVASAAGQGIGRMTENLIRGDPLSQGVVHDVALSAVTAGVIGIVPGITRVGRSAWRASAHQQDSFEAASRAASRWLAQGRLERQAAIHALDPFEERMRNAWVQGMEHNQNRYEAWAKAFWRGGIRDRLLSRYTRNEIAEKFTDKLTHRAIEKGLDELV